MNINLNKPSNINKLNDSNLPVTTGKISSEYVPIFTVLGANSPYFYTNDYKFHDRLSNNIPNDYNNLYRKLNSKYNNKALNTYNWFMFNKVLMSRNIQYPAMKIQLAELHKQATNWIFSTEINNYIVNYRSSRTSQWDNLTDDFKKGYNQYLSRYNFVDTPIEATYGYIGEIVENKIHSPLICLMVKKENIPFVRANWLMNIPIPEGVIEGWVLDKIDSPKYAKQSLRKSFKENIFPQITNQGIAIIKKTREELDGIWFHYREPVFKTISARNKWLDELAKKFISSEKQRLQIIEKPKFSFGSVKTYIKSPIIIEEDGLSATITVDSNGVIVTGNNSETSVLLRAGFNASIGHDQMQREYNAWNIPTTQGSGLLGQISNSNVAPRVEPNNIDLNYEQPF